MLILDNFKKYREYKQLRRLGADVIIKKSKYGVESGQKDEQVIVSLTSFPERINYVDKTIRTLLNQSVKPSRLILWLAEGQFPKGEACLPVKLQELKKNGLEIRWVKEDIKSYKKLIPTLQQFPEAVIITVDDDWYYHRDLIKILMEEHYCNPQMIISNLITHPYLDSNGELHSADNLDQYNGSSNLCNKILGYGGVLYPPGCFNKEVFNGFMDIAPTNDDIWFWAMAVLNNTKTKVPEKPVKMIAMTVPEIQNTVSLSQLNESQNLYITTTNDIFDKYPEIKSRLIEEMER